jgi:mersacidin/lichenicidin family type 2 lantibiotic
MSPQTIVHAWKDESYRSSLSEAEKAALPANPAGVIEFSAAKSDQAGIILWTLNCSSICTASDCPHLTEACSSGCSSGSTACCPY